MLKTTTAIDPSDLKTAVAFLARNTLKTKTGDVMEAFPIKDVGWGLHIKLGDAWNHFLVSTEDKVIDSCWSSTEPSGLVCTGRSFHSARPPKFEASPNNLDLAPYIKLVLSHPTFIAESASDLKDASIAPLKADNSGA